MTKLSIIVPVYNCENYVDACLSSILNQNFTDFELIIVDDGSTDNSLQKCKAFEKDSRVKIISKENEGVSIARNTGLKLSAGEYVMFVDSDDILVQAMFQSMIEQISQTNADLCVCGIKNFLVSDKYNEIWKYKSGVYNRVEYVKLLLQFYTNPFVGGPYAKLFKKEFLLDDVVFEPNESFAEDFVFNMKYLRKVEKICVLDDVYYLRRADNPASLSKSKRLQIPLWERKKYVFEEWNKTLSYLSDSSVKDIVLIQKFAVKSMIDICFSAIENNKTSLMSFIAYVLLQTDDICENNYIKSYRIIRKLFYMNKSICILFLKFAGNPKLQNNNFIKVLNK